MKTGKKRGLEQEGRVNKEVIISDSDEKVLSEDMIVMKIDYLDYIDEDSSEVQLQVRN